MKNIILFSLLLSLTVFFGCDDDTKAPIDQLPPATQMGENTFGCLINGEAFVVGNGFDEGMVAQYQFNTFSISTSKFENDEFVASIIFAIESNPVQLNQTYEFDTLNDFTEFSNIVCRREKENLISGSMVLTRFDTQARIVSGTFEFTTFNPDCGDTIRITDGRFDLRNLIL